ncbi:hypothetical protein C0J52_14218, partial [Blattella germanica]
TGAEPDSDEEAEEADPGLGDAEEADEQKAANKVPHIVGGPGPGPLLAHTEISSSQMDFFRMLDEKIENGPDYDSANEEEIAMERARLCSLLRDWETASTNSSLNRSAPPTPAHRKLPAKPQGPPPQQYYHPHVNGELFLQQQQQHQYHMQQQQHQQYIQYTNRGQYVVPSPPQITRMTPVMRNYAPPQHSSSIVQYRQSRGAYTELA